MITCAITVGQEIKGDPDVCDWNSEDLEDEEFAEADNKLERCDALEPYVGMEFDSEDDARRFYNDYARSAGFVVRVMQRRHSEIDGRILARRLGCNKQGFSPNPMGKSGTERNPRQSAREGCKATILFKMEKNGKWVVTIFVKEHNYPLVVVSQQYKNVGDKEKKIQELARELQRQEEICASYRESLISLLSNIEKQGDNLSMKVLAVVQNVRKAEAEAISFVKS